MRNRSGLTVLVQAALLALAGFPVTAGTAADYVQDGLVLHLDGIENVGLGQAHDSSATTWTDLTGNGFDWTINLSAATWHDAGLHFNGSGYPGTTTKTATDLQNKITTIEFVYRNEVKSDTIIFALGMGRTAYLYTDTSARVGVYDYLGYAAALGSTNTYSTLYARSGATPTGVSAMYVNGQQETCVRMGDYWNFDGTTCMLGNRPSGSSKPAKGVLMALRIYDRALTDEERATNAQLDAARFGFTLPVPMRTVTASAVGGGLVSLDGVTYATSVTTNVAQGTALTVLARDTDAATFFMWVAKTGSLPEADRTSSAHAFTAKTDASFEAMFTAASGGGDTRLAKYSFDGLLDMWDGISNVSLTNAHDDAATTWNDLIGTRHMTVSTTHATVISNALDCLGTGNAAAAGSAQTGYYTIEIAMDPPASSAEQIVFSGGAVGRIVATSPSVAYMLEGAAAGPLYYTGTEPNTFAFTYSSSGVSAFYEGGTQKTLCNGSSGWSNVPGTVNVGSRSGSYCYKGRVYAIRLYSRVLTAAELARHAVLDGRRFFGVEEPEPAVVGVRGGGKVSVNGATASASQEIEAEYGDTLRLEPVPDAGMEFVAWEADGVDLTGTNIVASPLTLTFSSSLRRLTAVFLPADGRVDARVTDYSYDGLLGLWDGICNVGYGYAHDSATNVWKDLAGIRDLTLAEGCGSFTDNALACLSRSSGVPAGPAVALPNVRTYEIVCERADNAIALNFGAGDLVAFCSGGVLHHTPGLLYGLSTNVATLCFVKDATLGWTVFENGAEVLTRDRSDHWSVHGQMTVGGSLHYPGSYLYRGRIYAVRAYDRALSPLEVAKHSDLDQKRFFGCAQVDADRGIRVRGDGTVECLLRVAADGPGKIAVDGTAVASGDFWFPQGTVVSLEARTEGDFAFLGWVDDDRRLLANVAAYGAKEISVTVSRKSVLGAAFVRSRVLRRASASAYARSGLTAHWDGLENAGLGLAHDATAATWKDLSAGGRDWAIDVGASASWSAKGLVLAGTGLAGTLASGAPAVVADSARTAEFVYATGTKRNGIVFTVGADKCRVYTDLNGHVGFRAHAAGEGYYGYAPALGETNAYSAVNEEYRFDWFAVNGAPRANNGMADYWSKCTDLTEIGAMSDGAGSGVYGDGEILAIRLYNRRLTGAERLLNAHLDAIRYLGEIPPAPPGAVLSVR